MTNLERIFTWAYNRKIAMKEALVLAFIAEYKYVATITIAKRMKQMPRTIAPIIQSLKNKGLVVQHGEKEKADDRLKHGPKMRVQWRLTHEIQIQMDALENRAPTLPKTKPIKPRPVIPVPPPLSARTRY